MDMDFDPFLREYERLSKAAEESFKRIEHKHSDCVNCKIQCTECCYALFDLSLVEAIYINQRFKEISDKEQKEKILERASRSDRKVHKIKKKAYKDYEAGKSEEEILEEMATERVPCPLLNENGHCELYEHRPITCKLYGVPTAIGGKGRTCGKSGFKKGTAYPTVNLDIIHKKLYELSSELARALRSRYAGLGEMLVPLSMALLNEYDEAYLGTGEADSSENKKGE